MSISERSAERIRIQKHTVHSTDWNVKRYSESPGEREDQEITNSREDQRMQGKRRQRGNRTVKLWNICMETTGRTMIPCCMCVSVWMHAVRKHSVILPHTGVKTNLGLSGIEIKLKLKYHYRLTRVSVLRLQRLIVSVCYCSPQLAVTYFPSLLLPCCLLLPQVFL